MGASRKYPYHTTRGILEFQGQGGFFGLEFQSHGREGFLTHTVSDFNKKFANLSVFNLLITDVHYVHEV